MGSSHITDYSAPLPFLQNKASDCRKSRDLEGSVSTARSGHIDRSNTLVAQPSLLHEALQDIWHDLLVASTNLVKLLTAFFNEGNRDNKWLHCVWG